MLSKPNISESYLPESSPLVPQHPSPPTLQKELSGYSPNTLPRQHGVEFSTGGKAWERRCCSQKNLGWSPDSPLTAVGPWGNELNLSVLCLSFHLCKMKTVIVPAGGAVIRSQ